MEASEKSSRSGFGFSDVFFCAILTLLRERVVVVVVDGWMDGGYDFIHIVASVDSLLWLFSISVESFCSPTQWIKFSFSPFTLAKLLVESK